MLAAECAHAHPLGAALCGSQNTEALDLACHVVAEQGPAVSKGDASTGSVFVVHRATEQESARGRKTA